jgi:DNA recombination protein RmuC
MNSFTLIIVVAGSALAGALMAGWFIKMQFTARIALLQADHAREKQNLESQKNFFEQAAKEMKDAFGSLAADALHKNNQTFVTLAESKLSEKVTEANAAFATQEKAMSVIIGPLSQSLEKMDQKINELENKRERAYGNINAVLEEMQKATHALGKGTQDLLSALKNSSTRGRYGEIGLRRVVEFAGMTEHCDFIEQVTVRDEDNILRPDMIIHLPELKTIVVDSKTPLEAYMKIFETDNESEQKLLLNQHANAVRQHLKNLSARAYWTQFRESPDYVVLYMQIESSFGAALQTDPSLIEEGIRNKVIFATPTTLVTLLRTVGFVWQQRTVAENIEEIRDAAIGLYDRTAILLKHFSNIGVGLRTAVSHYNNAVSSLESRFIPQAKKLYVLGSAYTKNALPETEQVTVAVRQLNSPDEQIDDSPNIEGPDGLE